METQAKRNKIGVHTYLVKRPNSQFNMKRGIVMASPVNNISTANALSVEKWP